MSLLKLTISERQRGGVKENKVEFLHHLLNLKKSQSPQYSALSFVLENLKRQKQDLTLCETQPLMNCRLVYYSWSWNNLKDIPFFYPPLLSHPQGWRVFELGGGGGWGRFFHKSWHNLEPKPVNSHTFCVSLHLLNKDIDLMHQEQLLTPDSQIQMNCSNENSIQFSQKHSKKGAEWWLCVLTKSKQVKIVVF